MKCILQLEKPIEDYSLNEFLKLVSSIEDSAKDLFSLLLLIGDDMNKLLRGELYSFQIRTNYMDLEEMTNFRNFMIDKIKKTGQEYLFPIFMVNPDTHTGSAYIITSDIIKRFYLNCQNISEKVERMEDFLMHLYLTPAYLIKNDNDVSETLE